MMMVALGFASATRRRIFLPAWKVPFVITPVKVIPVIGGINLLNLFVIIPDKVKNCHILNNLAFSIVE